MYVDLSRKYLSYLMVVRENFEFFVGTEYESFPSFCTKCVGQLIHQCKNGREARESEVFKKTTMPENYDKFVPEETSSASTPYASATTCY